jgi:hypothetical protein
MRSLVKGDLALLSVTELKRLCSRTGLKVHGDN